MYFQPNSVTIFLLMREWRISTVVDRRRSMPNDVQLERNVNVLIVIMRLLFKHSIFLYHQISVGHLALISPAAIQNSSTPPHPTHTITHQTSTASTSWPHQTKNLSSSSASSASAWRPTMTSSALVSGTMSRSRRRRRRGSPWYWN